jgi:hypothetical protein
VLVGQGRLELQLLPAVNCAQRSAGAAEMNLGAPVAGQVANAVRTASSSVRPAGLRQARCKVSSTTGTPVRR